MYKQLTDINKKIFFYIWHKNCLIISSRKKKSAFGKNIFWSFVCVFLFFDICQQTIFKIIAEQNLQ